MSGYRRWQLILHDDEGYLRTLSFKHRDKAREGFERIAKHGMFSFVIIRQMWLVDRDGPEDTLSIYEGTLDYWKDPLYSGSVE